MNLNRPALTTIKILVLFGLVYFFAKPALATEYQNCATNQSCTLGEFLYDDSYTPDATASCTMSSRSPDGNIFINSGAMTASSSGWYSYSATIGTQEGVYPSQICCTTASTEYLCLDKTFIVKAPTTSGGSTISAADVWNYPDRSVTTFGTLIADIWNYNTRSLTNFGNLITDLWSHNNRTLTSATNSTITYASNADILEIKKVTKENRLLLEQLINKPIVNTFIDQSLTPNLSTKIEQTKTIAGNLFSSIQNLKSRALILSEKWPTLSSAEVKTELTTLSAIFKQDTNQKDSNIISSTTWLKTSWNSPVLLSLSNQATAAQSKIDSLINDLNLYSKSTKADAFAPALSNILSLNDLVGTSFASADDLSLFGFIKKTTDRVALLDKETQEAQTLYAQIKKDTVKDHTAEVTALTSKILTINEIAQVDSFFVRPTKKTNTLSNKVLSLIALIDTNKLLLAGNTGIALKNLWLEEGSIIFRTVALNPSHSITQKVMVKYSLPTEVKKEQVISNDPQLTLNYDPSENALVATGEISLAPQETRTFLVEVEDIWNFKQEEINSLKTQASDLVVLLKNTSYYSQAASIKTDIDITLDKIMLRQSQAITPENRIRTYRESSLDMNGVETKIASIKELVLVSQSSGNAFAGLKNITLWGIVLFVIAGFAFLLMYFNALRSDAKTRSLIKKTAIKPKDIEFPKPTIHHHSHRGGGGGHLGHRIVKIGVIILITSGISSLGASAAIKLSKTQILTQKTSSSNVLGTSTEKKYPYPVTITITDSKNIPVHSGPSISSPEIKSLKETQTIYIFKKTDGWYQIGNTDRESNQNTWINGEYLPNDK